MLVFAGAKRTSPSWIISSDDEVNVPSPSTTIKMDGPGIDGNSVVDCSGRIQRSTSNSSKGGMYLIT